MSDDNKSGQLDVMGEIKKRGVKMHSRWYFGLVSVVLGVGVGAALVTALMFVMVVTIRLRVGAPFGFLGFGGRGLWPFMAIFPWGSLVVAVLGVVLGLWLLKRYDFSYRKSFLGWAVGLVALIVVIGAVVGQMAMMSKVHEGRLAPWLNKGRPVGQNWVVGVVNEVKPPTVLLMTRRGDEIRVTWDEDLVLPGDEIRVGSHLRAIGSWDEDVFRAEDIRLRHPDKGIKGWRGKGPMRKR